MKIIDGVKCYTVTEYDYTKLKDFPRVKKKGKHGKTYLNCVAAFDIETSSLKDIEQAFMYVWQACIDDEVIIGRTWNSFRTFCHMIRLNIEDGETFVFYVHNLSYEMHFLKGVYRFEAEDTFCTAPRKFLKANIMAGSIEFRCSYIHSNMNLSMFTEKFKAKHVKLSGETFDYDRLRYPWTPLTDDELNYCVNDVVGLCEALKNEMAVDGDDIATIPLTSTGYVRRDIKKAMRTFSRDWLNDLLPDYDTYIMLRDAFRGGDTHASRLMSGRTLENVTSVDVASSYPAQQLLELYPMGRFYDFKNATWNDYNDLIRDNKAILFRVRFKNLRLRDLSYGNPYFSFHKLNNSENVIQDNGRVLSADMVEVTLTDIDFKIVQAVYDWTGDGEILKLKFAAYGKLPKQIREQIMKYFHVKTTLKGDAENELFYLKSKNKLNSIYGMTATMPIRRRVLFEDNVFRIEDIDERSELQRYNKTAFLSYAWGVWCTALARHLLFRGIYEAACERFIYCDTDSVKFLTSASVMERLNIINEEQRAKADAECAYIDYNGKRYYMGIFEDDGHYKQFKTLGAKKYCYVTDDDKLKITIAGVGKHKGAKELETIENFKIGRVFHEAGGNESVYNDGVNYDIEIDGHTLKITDNIFIKPSSYTLGVTDDYFNLIRMRVTGDEVI